MRNETKQQKEQRIFEVYKKDLEKLGNSHNQIRFICIEFVCRFPKIDPYKMGTALKKEGYNIVFDDSSISESENRKKEKTLEKLAFS